MQDSFPPSAYVAPVPAAPRYGRLQALVLCFFSAELYRDIARRWRGIGFFYLVLLLAISFLPVAIEAQIGVSRFARNDAAAALLGFPAITITKGVVSIDRPEPYLWKDPQTGAVLLYVDTTDTFDLPEGASALLKLGRSSMEVRQDQYSSRKYDLSQIPNFYVDRVRLQGWLDTGSKWIGTVIFAGGVFGSLIWHLIQILIYAAIGLVFCQMFGARLQYPALLRLAAVAITPAILLSTVFGMINIDVPYSGLLYLVMELGFLAFAVKANAEPAAMMPSLPISFPPPPMPQ